MSCLPVYFSTLPTNISAYLKKMDISILFDFARTLQPRHSRANSTIFLIIIGIKGVPPLRLDTWVFLLFFVLSFCLAKGTFVCQISGIFFFFPPKPARLDKNVSQTDRILSSFNSVRALDVDHVDITMLVADVLLWCRSRYICVRTFVPMRRTKGQRYCRRCEAVPQMRIEVFIL